jgi:fumarate hydratase subunit alpha
MNPLTQETTYKGKDMPILSFDLAYNADYIEITCSPKGLGSGRWADLQIFSFPSLETIEKYIIEVVTTAGSQPCPPMIIGVGIGGTFDYAAKMAKQAMLEKVGRENPDPFLRKMEERLLTAINKMGIGPMGTGGEVTALAIHIKYAAGHGFVPVAVCFNCWVNRKLSARIYNNGKVEYFE